MWGVWGGGSPPHEEANVPERVAGWGFTQTGSCVRDPVAGLFIVISDPVRGGGSVPVGLGARLCFAKSNKKLFCEMMELPWCFLHGF